MLRSDRGVYGYHNNGTGSGTPWCGGTRHHSPVDGDRFDPGRERMGLDANRGHWYQRVDQELEAMGDLEWTLWIVVAVALVGDVVTTFVGLHLGLAESNPIARAAINGWGLVGMLVLKAFAVGVALCCRPLLPREFQLVVPAGLAVPWLVAVVINLVMISTAL